MSPRISSKYLAVSAAFFSNLADTAPAMGNLRIQMLLLSTSREIYLLQVEMLSASLIVAVISCFSLEILARVMVTFSGPQQSALIRAVKSLFWTAVTIA